MLTYLSDKAPNFEKQHRSRNFIVEETETNNIIVQYLSSHNYFYLVYRKLGN